MCASPAPTIPRRIRVVRWLGAGEAGPDHLRAVTRFGLSVVIPAVAGPFNLGDVIVQRRPHSTRTPRRSRREASAGAAGGIPQMLDGIPLRIRMLTVTLATSAFTFNPTNCEAKRRGHRSPRPRAPRRTCRVRSRRRTAEPAVQAGVVGQYAGANASKARCGASIEV